MSNGIDTRLLVGHMPLVRSYHSTLSELGDWWRKVTLIGKINSLQIAATLLEDMEGTKRKFEKLQTQLIDNLVKENLRKQEQELSAHAQVSIDILIRNLFERTADVGFLATDDDLRAFLRKGENDSREKTAIVQRLHEYTLKYSVYDEIIVLDPDGRVRVHLDETGNPISHSNDPLIKQTLRSNEPYVETFRHSDLQPGRRHSLIYSARITESDDAYSPVLGVLCLCFRFDDEMAGIFANLHKGHALVAILDKDGHVIASSDERQLGCGSHVQRITGNRVGIVKHDNEAHLARTAKTKGYQGFYGLSWQGHVMSPLKAAFVSRPEHTADHGEMLAGSRFFSEELRTIAKTATTVTDDLILVVLNGQIVSAKRDAKEFMPVLDEIRRIGRLTKGVFEDSIANLYGTVVSSLLSDVQFQAFLAVDIMDRNLYERANDVRWWALTSRFRALMSKPALTMEERDSLSAVLAYINNLYTVYTNLFLYDAEGKILAVSQPNAASLVGTCLPMDGHFKQALGVNDSQRYVVSPFEASPLYGDRHTYIYLTAVRDPMNGRAVGGIGIVFDSEPQFAAMLADALPRDDDGEILPGAFGLFADRGRRVISSTDEAFQPGQQLALEPRFFELEKGERLSTLADFNGGKYAVGAAMSQGYREYKTSDDYENDVIGLIFVPV